MQLKPGLYFWVTGPAGITVCTAVTAFVNNALLQWLLQASFGHSHPGFPICEVLLTFRNPISVSLRYLATGVEVSEHVPRQEN